MGHTPTVYKVEPDVQVRRRRAKVPVATNPIPKSAIVEGSGTGDAVLTCVICIETDRKSVV